MNTDKRSSIDAAHPVLDRRTLLALAGGAGLAALLPATEAAAAGETAALIKLVTGTKSDDFSTVETVATAARKIGWEVPTKGSQLKLIGPWNYISNKKQKGTFTIEKGGKVSYSAGQAKLFSAWEVLTSKAGDRAALLVLTTPQGKVHFQYFQRPGIAFISAVGNRKTWYLLTVG